MRKLGIPYGVRFNVSKPGDMPPLWAGETKDLKVWIRACIESCLTPIKSCTLRACIESYLKAPNNCTFRQVISTSASFKPALSFRRSQKKLRQ